MKKYIDLLAKNHTLSVEDYRLILNMYKKKDMEYLALKACEVREPFYQKRVFMRGLIEFTNYCKNNCYYCGIRRDNTKVSRYRLTKEQILECCENGYLLGFRTFVLQGGEDPYYTTERMTDIIRSIRERYSDCAITLSIGEQEFSVYEAYYKAGANRYLLRHETANRLHYEKLHPKEMSFDHRMKCIQELKQIGFQVGCGIMVGSPYQTIENIVEDLKFIEQLKPDMVGIGPFLPHHDTPFKNEPKGSMNLTLVLLSLIRLILPEVLLPSTTALGTIDPRGRELGILSGANVVMPNLSPLTVREKYLLYDNKICTGDEAAESVQNLRKRMQDIGHNLVIDRGDNVCHVAKTNK